MSVILGTLVIIVVGPYIIEKLAGSNSHDNMMEDINSIDDLYDD